MQDQQEKRRSFLRGILALIGLALLHPLLRFTGFTVRPQAKQVEVKAPLQSSGFHAERDFFLFTSAHTGEAWAVSRTCTHLGCRVNFLEEQQIIECPCHQSRFSPQGERLAGPAPKNLPVYPVQAQRDEAGKVISYLVTIHA